MRLYETNRYNDGPDNVLTYVTSRCLDRRLRQASVDKVWKFRDRRDKETKVEVKDGFLGMINPKGKWEQMTPDKAMLERDVPASSQDLVVSGIFFSAPDKPQGCWHGVFIFGEDQMVFACLVVEKPIKHRKPWSVVWYTGPGKTKVTF